MSLTLNALYEPLNAFFLERIGAQPGGSMAFRFDKVGSVISDADFVNPANPAGGPVAALAVERFSDLVNRVPVDTGDDLHVVMSQRSIDDTYFYRFLNPAAPQVPPGVTGAAAQSVTDAFMVEKAEAVKRFTTTQFASASGVMLNYKPSFAAPTDWYSPTATGWSHYEYQASAPASSASTSGSGVWTVRPDPELLRKKLPELVLRPQPEPQPDPDGHRAVESLREAIARVRFEPVDTLGAAAGVAVDRPGLEGVDVVRSRVDIGAVAAVTRPAIFGLTSPKRSPRRLGKTPKRATVTAVPPLDRLDVRDRLRVAEIIASEAPAAPATTTTANISFDYCVVTADRPWLMSTFLSGGNWSIPGRKVGTLTGSAPGEGMWSLPAATVVIRNLVITAAWDAADIARSHASMSFGPFKIDKPIVNGSLTNPGLQTIGWLLDVLPPLPPRE